MGDRVTEATERGLSWIMLRPDETRLGRKVNLFQHLLGADWLPVQSLRPRPLISADFGWVDYVLLDAARLTAERRAELAGSLALRFGRTLDDAADLLRAGFPIPLDRVAATCSSAAPPAALPLPLTLEVRHAPA